MWLIAESKSGTSSITQANSPYSCFSDLARGGPKVKREDNFGPENSCTYKIFQNTFYRRNIQYVGVVTKITIEIKNNINNKGI